MSRKDKTKKQKEKKPRLPLRQVFSHNLFILRLMHRVVPGYIFWTTLFDLLWTVIGFFSGSFLLKYIVDGLGENTPVERLYLFVGGLFALHVLLRMIQNWYWNVIAEEQHDRMVLSVRKQLYAQMGAVELSCYEDPTYYEKYLKAMSEATNRCRNVLRSLQGLLSTLFALFANSLLLFTIDPVLLVFALIPFAAGFLNAARNRRAVAEHNDMQKVEWRTSYIQRTFFLADYAKEMRLTEMPDKMLADYDGTLREYETIKRHHGRHMVIFDYLTKVSHEVLTVLGAGFYALYASMVRDTMTPGDCLVVINSIGSVSSYLSGFITNLTSFQENALYIENLRSFLDYRPAIAEDPNGLSAGAGLLTAEHISYRYTGAETDALSDISLRVSPGEKIALVGQNGSGKTTFVKLLLHMYQPAGGQIALDGQGMDAYRLSSWRQDFVPVFQDYRIFAMSVAENVLCRPMRRDPAGEAADRARVMDALQKSGVWERVEKMPHGMDTMLTREFDDQGVVPSGGEAQKIALARVFASDAPFVVLDEPTSALDPVAEYTLFENMMEACRDRAVIFISHRLSSAVLADRIYLFEQGRVTESGGHAELMVQDGHYAAMFRRQAESYVETPSETAAKGGMTHEHHEQA